MAPSLTEERLDLPLAATKSLNMHNGLETHAASTVNLTEDDLLQPAAQPTNGKGKYNAIPGALGLASASLEGKVALVTGAGKFLFAQLFLCLPGFSCAISSFTLTLESVVV